MIDYRHVKEVERLSAQNRRLAVHAVLPMVFDRGMAARPKVIVELGVSKDALMNQVLGMIAEECGSKMWSVDFDKESLANLRPGCTFILDDARNIGLTVIMPKIDLLTIDLDELYDTTTKVWNAWRPNLSDYATVMFRCTNLKKELIYSDGTTTRLGWDNDRGVIRVLEDFFNEKFDETLVFHGWYRSIEDEVWDLFHWPWGAGLTVIRKKGIRRISA